MPAARFIDLPCFAPVRDGRALPDHPFSPEAAASTKKITMLIGHNAQEMSFFWGNDPGAFTLDQAGYEARIKGFAGDAAPDIIAAYARAYPDATPARRYLQAFSDYSLALPVMAQADRHASAGGRTYAYRLDFQSPALDTPEASRALLGPGDAPVMLARQMSEAWVRFAATGDPNGAGLPVWPRYDSKARDTMIFDTQSSVARDPNALARRIMADLLRA
jgi:para-nitrobenzyl esterase